MNRLLGVGAWGIGCLAVCALAMEATVRFDDWAQHGVPISSGVTGIDDLVTVDSLGKHPAANRQYRYFRSNNLGFRGPDISETTLANHPVVVTSGASETFGLYESKNHEWPRLLENRLSNACPSATPVVLNAGFAGMSLPTITQDVRLRLSRLRPRVIVLYPTPVQYLEPKLPKAKLPTTTSTPAPPAWTPRSSGRFRDAVKAIVPERILDWLRRRDTRSARQGQGAAVWISAPPERLDAFEAELRRFVGTVRAIRATPILGVHQNRFRDTTSVIDQRWIRAWERFYPNASGQALLQFEMLAAARTRLVAADSGVGLVDPSPQFRGPTDRLFADFVHFTDSGAAILADAIAPAVGKALGCRSGSPSAQLDTFLHPQSTAPGGDPNHRSR